VKKLFEKINKAIINGDIIIKLIDTLGEEIDWDDLRGWYYHPLGVEFNDAFNFISSSPTTTTMIVMTRRRKRKRRRIKVEEISIQA
jgi:hypothetical protein